MLRRNRQDGRRRDAVQGGRAGIFEIGIQVALLATQRRPDGENPLDELTAAHAVAAKAALAPQDGEAQGSLRCVVGGLDSLVIYEGKQSLL